MILETLKNKIAEFLKLEEADFTYPPNADLGDLSLACFKLAKSENKNPAEVAKGLASLVDGAAELKKYFSVVKPVGPYLNFFISSEYLADSVINEVKKRGAEYGCNLKGQGKKVLVEFSNGNTHKEYHVGHLRNISYGDAVVRLFKANGYASIPVSYINDFGINAAKTIWNWQRNLEYQESSENKGYLLGKCYAAASRELNDHPEKKEEVSRIKKEIESRTGKNYKFWQETRQWSIDYFAAIAKELDIRFKHIFYESEEVADGLKLVQGLFDKGVLKKSEGAIIADLEKYNLGVLPVIRSDGTALYPVADLALASKKFKKYDPAISVYVVDVRQSLYFNQLFKVLELAGYQQPMIHLTYDFVTLPGGMMSSRTGNVITYEELKEKVFAKLLEETAKRHNDWSNKQIDEVALSLTISTIKFEMLKVSADKIITFNIDEALRFDGFTACYLQYGYARLRSIVRKSGLRLFSGRPDLARLNERKEKELLIKIAKYAEVISGAGEKYNPSEIAKYLFELVQLFNDYYHEVNILKADPKIKEARLALISAVSQVLINGLDILGLKALEEM